jgi:hypothetical protein
MVLSLPWAGPKWYVEIFYLLLSTIMVQEAGKQRAVWLIRYNAIFGSDHRLHIESHIHCMEARTHAMIMV